MHQKQYQKVQDFKFFLPFSGTEPPAEILHESLITLPETNIAPENRPLEKEILIGNHHF